MLKPLQNDDFWRITLIPNGQGPPMSVRMKRFLKYALRSFGLRCIDMDGGRPEIVTKYGKDNSNQQVGSEAQYSPD